MANNCIEWHLPASKPLPDVYIIAQTLDGEYIVDRLKSFSEWSEMVVRWAYLPQEIDGNYAKYQNALSDVEYYKEENEKLKKDVDDWHNKYLDLLGKQHNEHQRDAFVGKRSKFAIDELVTSGELYPGEFDSRSDNSDGDEHLTADDICELHESYDAGSNGKISRDEIREIVLECLRKEKERTADDGK